MNKCDKKKIREVVVMGKMWYWVWVLEIQVSKYEHKIYILAPHKSLPNHLSSFYNSKFVG
jgi:hypothetical protein